MKNLIDFKQPDQKDRNLYFAEQVDQKTIGLLIKEIIKVNPTTMMSGPAPFRIYPNSELYYEAVKQGYKEPSSLQEWADRSSEGWLSEEVLPWVKNPKRLKAIEFFCVNAYRYPTNIFHKVLIWLCRVRLKFNFYALPWEIFVTRFYVEHMFKEK